MQDLRFMPEPDQRWRNAGSSTRHAVHHLCCPV